MENYCCLDWLPRIESSLISMVIDSITVYEFEGDHQGFSNISIHNTIKNFSLVCTRWYKLIRSNRHINQLIFLKYHKFNDFHLELIGTNKWNLKVHCDKLSSTSITDLLLLPQNIYFDEIRLCCHQINKWLPIVLSELQLLKLSGTSRRVNCKYLSIGGCGNDHTWDLRLSYSNRIDGHDLSGRNELGHKGDKLENQIKELYSILRLLMFEKFDLIEPLYCSQCHNVDLHCQDKRLELYEVMSDSIGPVFKPLYCEHCNKLIIVQWYCENCFFKPCSCCLTEEKQYFENVEEFCGGVVCNECAIQHCCPLCLQWWSISCERFHDCHFDDT
mmetsp:Transcript_4993/g.5121  ORF Transcript_4993/g.5121 Transcript_4993/m.5121 type:complete len:330 (-) Transcript_4993:545-1534(-)